MVTGAVERGTVRVGDRVEVLGADVETVVIGVETFRRPMESAQPGDNVALLLRGVARGAVRRGHVVAAPGSVTPHRRFTARVYLLSGREGGRGTPVVTGYRPQFYLRTADVATLCTLGVAPVLFPAVGFTVELWGAGTFFAGCGAICLLAAGLGLAVPVLRRAELPSLRPA